MLDRKKQMIEDLIAHLDGSQGDALSKMIDDSRAPKDAMPMKPDGMPGEADGMEPEKDAMPGGDFNAKANDAIEAMKGPGDADMDAPGDDMTDEELRELLEKYLKQ